VLDDFVLGMRQPKILAAERHDAEVEVDAAHGRHPVGVEPSADGHELRLELALCGLSCKAAMVLSADAIFCWCLAVLISLPIAQKAASAAAVAAPATRIFSGLSITKIFCESLPASTGGRY
jgi:hypothetical protein